MANFTSKQLASGKWGIYSDSRLLATVASQDTCETVMANLSSGRKDAPANDVDALYQVSLRHLPIRHSSVGQSSLSSLLNQSRPAQTELPKTQDKLRNQLAAVKGERKSRKRAKVSAC